MYGGTQRIHGRWASLNWEMISSENIPINIQQRNKLIEYIKEVNDFLGKRYPIVSLTLSISVLVFILFLIYLTGEEGPLSILLKILTILPLWAIVMLNLRYFHNRLPAWELKRRYTKVMSDNGYKALRVKATSCEKYRDGLYDYLLFNIDQNKQLLLRLNDFSVDRERFPNDNFLIPPRELSDIIGNTIACEGKLLEAKINRDISKQLLAFRYFEKGRVMIKDLI